MRDRSPAFWVVACLALAGCPTLGGRPLALRLFVLEATAPAAPAADSAEGLAVGIGPVSVPEYASKRLVHRVGPNEVRLVETARWAEPLAAGVQRVLVANLAALLGSERVVAHPWRYDGRPAWSIEVQVLRFERSADGAAELEALWTLRRGQDLAPLHRATTRLARTPAGPGPDALVAALSASLGEWSHELAAALRAEAAGAEAASPPAPK